VFLTKKDEEATTNPMNNNIVSDRGNKSLVACFFLDERFPSRRTSIDPRLTVSGNKHDFPSVRLQVNSKRERTIDEQIE
jgi:hypothetical protein